MRIGWIVTVIAMVSYVLPVLALENAPNFRLLDQDGRTFELYRLDQTATIAILAFDPSNEDLIRAIPKRRLKKGKKFHKDTQVLLMVSGTTATREELIALRKEFRLNVPILLDRAGSVSRTLGLQNTGDIAFVSPSSNWEIIGRSRDLMLLSEKSSATEDMQSRTEQFENQRTPAVEGVSYSQDVAPILMGRCVNCHQKGGIGPFAMSSHAKVRGWADMMQEVILTKRMPPWHADPAQQHFKNALSLSPDEESILMSWLAAGASKGDEEPDPLAAHTSPETRTWALGEPDHILRMTKVAELPASGVVNYQYYYVPSGLTEDRWVRGLEVRAGNPAIVHHALIFVEFPPEYKHVEPSTQRGLSGFFGSFLPGSKVLPFPDGTAQFLPAGSTFIFQMHYSPTGKPESDQSELGLYFSKGAPAEVMQVGALATDEFKIKPRKADQPISVSHKLDTGFRLWGVLPHMHYRGQEFRYTVKESGKSAEVLLNVPWYQFDWQPMYWYDEPLDIPAGATLRIDGAFDNSKYNLLNPDPEQTVYFGEQSFDEMFIGYVSLSRPYVPEDYVAREVEPEPEGPITEAGLIGTKWDVGEARPLRFMKDGKLKLAWFKGTWKIEGNRILIELSGDEFFAEIVNNKLYFDGERLVRIG